MRNYAYSGWTDLGAVRTGDAGDRRLSIYCAKVRNGPFDDEKALVANNGPLKTDVVVAVAAAA